MRRRVLTGMLIGLVVLGLIIVVVLISIRGGNLVNVLGIVISGLFILGLVVRFVRAEPGQRLRETFGPIMDAGDVYQKLLMGRPTADESVYEASKHVARDKYSSEE